MVPDCTTLAATCYVSRYCLFTVYGRPRIYSRRERPAVCRPISALKIIFSLILPKLRRKKNSIKMARNPFSNYETIKPLAVPLANVYFTCRSLCKGKRSALYSNPIPLRLGSMLGGIMLGYIVKSISRLR